MKKIILSAILLAIATTVFCQQTTPEPLPIANTDYLQKAKNQKTGAWILLGGGLLTTGIGLVVVASEGANDAVDTYVGVFTGPNGTSSSSSTSSTGSILIATGILMQAGSIPLFIASKKNKRRAMLAIKDQKTAFGLPIPASKKVTGLTLSIPIGK